MTRFAIICAKKNQDRIKILQERINYLGLQNKIKIFGNGEKDLSQIEQDELRNFKTDPDALCMIMGHSYIYRGDNPLTIDGEKVGEFINRLKRDTILLTCLASAVFEEGKKPEGMNVLAVGGVSNTIMSKQSTQTGLFVIDLIAQNPDITNKEIFAAIAEFNPEPMSFFDKESGLVTKMPRPGKIPKDEVMKILDEISEDKLPTKDKELISRQLNTRKNKRYFEVEAIKTLTRNNPKFKNFYETLEEKKKQILTSKEVKKHLTDRSEKIFGEKKYVEKKEKKVNLDDIKQKKLVEDENLATLDWLFYTISRISKKKANLKTAIEIIEKNPQLIRLENRDGQTALMQAVNYKITPIINLLIDKGADLSAVNKALKKTFETVLIYAIRTKDEALFKKIITKSIIEKIAINTDAQDKNGYTALMYAILNKNVNMVNILVNEKFADIILTANDNVTNAVSLAKASNNPEIIKIIDKAYDNYIEHHEVKREAVNYWIEKSLEEIQKQTKEDEQKEIEVKADQKNSPDNKIEEEANTPKQHQKQPIPTFTFYNADVYPRYMDTQLVLQGIRAERSEYKRRSDLFLFVVPVRKETHSCAVIVDHNQKKIFFLDPFGNTIPQEIFDPLKRLFYKYEIISSKTIQQHDRHYCDIYSKINIIDFLTRKIRINDKGYIERLGEEIDINQAVGQYFIIEKEYATIQETLAVESVRNRHNKSSLRDVIKSITENKEEFQTLHPLLRENLKNIKDSLEWETGQTFKEFYDEKAKQEEKEELENKEKKEEKDEKKKQDNELEDELLKVNEVTRDRKLAQYLKETSYNRFALYLHILSENELFTPENINERNIQDLVKNINDIYLTQAPIVEKTFKKIAESLIKDITNENEKEKIIGKISDLKSVIENNIYRDDEGYKTEDEVIEKLSQIKEAIKNDDGTKLDSTQIVIFNLSSIEIHSEDDKDHISKEETKKLFPLAIESYIEELRQVKAQNEITQKSLQEIADIVKSSESRDDKLKLIAAPVCRLSLIPNENTARKTLEKRKQELEYYKKELLGDSEYLEIVQSSKFLPKETLLPSIAVITAIANFIKDPSSPGEMISVMLDEDRIDLIRHFIINTKLNLNRLGIGFNIILFSPERTIRVFLQEYEKIKLSTDPVKNTPDKINKEIIDALFQIMAYPSYNHYHEIKNILFSRIIKNDIAEIDDNINNFLMWTIINADNQLTQNLLKIYYRIIENTKDGEKRKAIENTILETVIRCFNKPSSYYENKDLFFSRVNKSNIDKHTNILTWALKHEDTQGIAILLQMFDESLKEKEEKDPEVRNSLHRKILIIFIEESIKNKAVYLNNKDVFLPLINTDNINTISSIGNNILSCAIKYEDVQTIKILLQLYDKIIKEAKDPEAENIINNIILNAFIKHSTNNKSIYFSSKNLFIPRINISNLDETVGILTCAINHEDSEVITFLLLKFSKLLEEVEDGSKRNTIEMIITTAFVKCSENKNLFLSIKDQFLPMINKNNIEQIFTENPEEIVINLIKHQDIPTFKFLIQTYYKMMKELNDGEMRKKKEKMIAKIFIIASKDKASYLGVKDLLLPMINNNNFDESDQLGNNIIINAIKHEDTQTAKFLLQIYDQLIREEVKDIEKRKALEKRIATIFLSCGAISKNGYLTVRDTFLPIINKDNINDTVISRKNILQYALEYNDIKSIGTLLPIYYELIGEESQASFTKDSYFLPIETRMLLLIYAVQHNEKNLVRFLFNKNIIDKNAIVKSLDNILQEACNLQDPTILQLVLNKINEKQDSKNQTNSDSNFSYKIKSNFLCDVIKSDKMDFIEILVKNGADLGALDDNNNALILAEKLKNKPAFNLLAKEISNYKNRLIIAVKSGNINLVKNFLSEIEDLNEAGTDKEGNNVLMCAISGTNKEILSLIWKKMLELPNEQMAKLINSSNSAGQTPLSKILNSIRPRDRAEARKTAAEYAKFLIEKDVNLFYKRNQQQILIKNFTAEFSNNIFTDAAKFGNVEIFKMILDKRNIRKYESNLDKATEEYINKTKLGILSEIDEPTPNGENALIIATSSGNLEIGQLLLENGASPLYKHFKQQFNAIAISCVINKNSYQFTKLLIDKIKEDYSDKKEIAQAVNNVSTQHLVTNRDPIESILSYCIRKNKNDLAQLLLENGSDPFSVEENVLTVCEKNLKELIHKQQELELQETYDLLTQEFHLENETAVSHLEQIIKESSEPKLLRLLNHKNAQENTLLFEAILAQNENLIKLLISNGAEISHHNNNKSNIFICAALTGNIKILSTIIDLTTKDKITSLINERDETLDSPLSISIRSGNLEMTKLLLENGANPYLLTSDEIDKCPDPQVKELIATYVNSPEEKKADSSKPKEKKINIESVEGILKEEKKKIAEKKTEENNWNFSLEFEEDDDEKKPKPNPKPQTPKKSPEILEGDKVSKNHTGQNKHQPN